MKRHSIKLFTVVVIVLLLIGCATVKPYYTRPNNWAQSIQIKGVSNFYKVSPSLYRSAQPTSEGMTNLKAMGIVTVINLRSFNSDLDEIGDTGLAYESIPMHAWHIEVDEVVRFLQIVTDPKRTPILVHCQHGSDRTGTMVAAYRIIVQGWSKEAAIEEMKFGGYGYHTIWKNLLTFINELDVDSVKQRIERR